MHYQTYLWILFKTLFNFYTFTGVGGGIVTCYLEPYVRTWQSFLIFIVYGSIVFRIARYFQLWVVPYIMHSFFCSYIVTWASIRYANDGNFEAFCFIILIFPIHIFSPCYYATQRMRYDPDRELDLSGMYQEIPVDIETPLIDVCAVCLESMNSGVVELPCKHAYHKACIDEWLCREQSCPMCRVSTG